MNLQEKVKRAAEIGAERGMDTGVRILPYIDKTLIAWFMIASYSRKPNRLRSNRIVGEQYVIAKRWGELPR
jgi:hypothetical protein